MIPASTWIERLALKPLPEEGGLYSEFYRSDEILTALPPRFSGPRCCSTAIYYLLARGEFSAFHAVQQDELWHFYAGSPFAIHAISPNGDYTLHKLGTDIEAGARPMAVVPRGHLFAAEVSGPYDYGLAGCTVAPGFEFSDFSAPPRAELLARFPTHKLLIEKFTRA